MPLPMVHLSVAVQAHALAGQPLTPAFVLGSLAPDAIHMRPGTTREDKVFVHFNINEANEAEAMQRALALIKPSHSRQQVPDPFSAGYATHLLVDYWWRQAVVQPFAQQLPTNLQPAERRAMYYQETDQIDFDLYHCEPWCKTVWDMLADAQAPEFPPYLHADEIDGWRQRTLNWFEKIKQEPGIQPQIITGKVVERFVAGSAERLQPILFGPAT